MRKPTPPDVALAYHANAMLRGLGDDLPVTEDPQCGWYKCRLVKGGPFVPARIYLEGEIDPDTGELVDNEILKCEINGQQADPVASWLSLAKRPISETEYKYLTAVALHAAWYSPEQPQANPRKPIDWLKVDLPPFNGDSDT